jgi:hypothetical protein
LPGTRRYPFRCEHALAIRTAFHPMMMPAQSWSVTASFEAKAPGEPRGSPGDDEERPFQVPEACDSRRALVTSGFGYGRRTLQQLGNLPLSALCESALSRHWKVEDMSHAKARVGGRAVGTWNWDHNNPPGRWLWT